MVISRRRSGKRTTRTNILLRQLEQDCIT